jgi:hypothetical protein
MIDFPASPVVGQEFDAVGFTYIWNGQGWTVKPLVLDDVGVDAYNKIESDARFVNVDGDVMTGDLTIQKAGPTLSLKKLAAGDVSQVASYDQNGHFRWGIHMTNGTLETGGGTGSGFGVYYGLDDNATYGTAFTISRVDGRVTLNGDPTAAMHAATKQYVDAKVVTGAYLPLAGGTLTGHLLINPGTLTVPANQNTLGTADGTSAAGAVTPADANIKFYDSGGGSGNWAGIGCDTGGSMWFRTGNSGTPIPRFWIGAGGGATFNTPATFNYQITATGAGFSGAVGAASFSATTSVVADQVFGKSGVYANYPTNDVYLLMYPNGANTILSLLGNWYFSLVRATGELTWTCGNGQGFNLNSQGGCSASNDDCRKPTGGPWWTWSDARVKDVVGEFTRGLDAVTALNPILCTFKGNDTKGPPTSWQDMTLAPEQRAGPPTAAPYVNSPHVALARSRKICISMVAQDVLPVFPELIMRESGYIDGEPVSDLHVMDTGPLIYALVNSCKELKAMNEQLAARVAVLEGAAA